MQREQDLKSVVKKMHDLQKSYEIMYVLRNVYYKLQERIDPGDDDAMYKRLEMVLEYLRNETEREYYFVLDNLKGLEFEIHEDFEDLVNENKF